MRSNENSLRLTTAAEGQMIENTIYEPQIDS